MNTENAINQKLEGDLKQWETPELNDSKTEKTFGGTLPNSTEDILFYISVS